MVYKVLIDDFRNDDGENSLPRMDLIIRNHRTYNMVKPILKKMDIVLFLDHDLGDTPESHYSPEHNGYKIIMDMFNDKIYPIVIHIVTANPVGRKNIEAALRCEGYSCNGIGEWTR